MSTNSSDKLGTLVSFWRQKITCRNPKERNLHSEMKGTYGLQCVSCQAVEISLKFDTTVCKTENAEWHPFCMG